MRWARMLLDSLARVFAPLSREADIDAILRDIRATADATRTSATVVGVLPPRERGVAGDTRAPAAGGVGIEEALRWVQAYTPDPYQVVDPALTPSRVRRPLWPDDELRAAETRPGARTDERSDP